MPTNKLKKLLKNFTINFGPQTRRVSRCFKAYFGAQW